MNTVTICEDVSKTPEYILGGIYVPEDSSRFGAAAYYVYGAYDDTGQIFISLRTGGYLRSSFKMKRVPKGTCIQLVTE